MVTTYTTSGEAVDPESVLTRARQTWPVAKLRVARKAGHCDNSVCAVRGGYIVIGERYIDPGESNPYRAGGYGGLRYCLRCGGGEPR